MDNTKYKALGLVTIGLLLVLALVLIGIGPLVTIWALNTLFSTSIAFTIQTWIAVFFLESALLVTFKK